MPRRRQGVPGGNFSDLARRRIAGRAGAPGGARPGTGPSRFRVASESLREPARLCCNLDTPRLNARCVLSLLWLILVIVVPLFWRWNVARGLNQ
jgi:hypothetical protein